MYYLSLKHRHVTVYVLTTTNHRYLITVALQIKYRQANILRAVHTGCVCVTPRTRHASDPLILF